MIHGGPGGSSCSFVSSLRALAADRPVIIYDQLGSGYSDRMVDLEAHARVPRFVAEVAAIRRDLNLEQVHLLGLSWGTAVALEYLLTADSGGVRSVTFAGPYVSTARWLQDADALLRTLPEDVQDAVSAAKASGNYEASEFRRADSIFSATYGIRTERDSAVRLDCARKPTGNSGLYEYMWGPSEYISTGTLRDYDRVADLHRLDLPVLWLIGEYDEVRIETARDFQLRVPGSMLKVLPGAGHGSMLDAPAEFNATVASFLRDAERRN